MTKIVEEAVVEEVVVEAAAPTEISAKQAKFNSTFGPKVSLVITKLEEMERLKHKPYMDYSAVPKLRELLINSVNAMCDALEAAPTSPIVGESKINFFG